MSIRGILARFDPVLTSGPIATTIAATVFALILAGAVGNIRTGRWPYRVMLDIGAFAWPLPDHPLQGRVVLQLTYLHGVHLADLLSGAAVVVAVLPWRRHRSIAGRDDEPSVATSHGQNAENQDQRR